MDSGCTLLAVLIAIVVSEMTCIAEEGVLVEIDLRMTTVDSGCLPVVLFAIVVAGITCSLLVKIIQAL